MSPARVLGSRGFRPVLARPGPVLGPGVRPSRASPGAVASTLDVEIDAGRGPLAPLVDRPHPYPIPGAIVDPGTF